MYFAGACVRDFGDEVTELFIENAHAMQAQAGDAAAEHRLVAVYPYDKGLARRPASPSVHNSRTGLMLLPGAYYSDAGEDPGRPIMRLVHEAVDSSVRRLPHGRELRHGRGTSRGPAGGRLALRSLPHP